MRRPQIPIQLLMRTGQARKTFSADRLSEKHSKTQNSTIPLALVEEGEAILKNQAKKKVNSKTIQILIKLWTFQTAFRPSPTRDVPKMAGKQTMIHIRRNSVSIENWQRSRKNLKITNRSSLIAFKICGMKVKLLREVISHQRR